MAVELDKIKAICERVAGSLGLEVVEVEFRGGAGKQGRVLRVYIDRAEGGPSQMPACCGSQPGTDEGVRTSIEQGGASQAGVTLEDCAAVSREVSTILDIEEVVPVDDYVLEVSSPGLDRKLTRPKDFEKYVGHRLKVMTHEPLGVTEKSKGNRHFEGRLEGFAGGRLTLDVNAPKHGAKPGRKQPELVVIELANVDRANLVPEV